MPLKNVVFEDIRMPDRAKVAVTNAENIQFTKVTTVSGAAPIYKITDSKSVDY